jgi:hypothetical protein
VCRNSFRVCVKVMVMVRNRVSDRVGEDSG